MNSGSGFALLALLCALLLQTAKCEEDNTIDGIEETYIHCLSNTTEGEAATEEFMKCYLNVQKAAKCWMTMEPDCVKKLFDNKDLADCIGKDNLNTLAVHYNLSNINDDFWCADDAKREAMLVQDPGFECFVKNQINLIMCYVENKVMIWRGTPLPTSFAGFVYDKDFCARWIKAVECEKTFIQNCPISKEVAKMCHDFSLSVWKATPCGISEMEGI